MDEEKDTRFIDPAEVAAQKQLETLTDQAHEGALFADWSRSACSVKLFKWLDEQISDSKNRWLSATSRESAESVRLQAQSYQKIKLWINAQIGAGAVASLGIKKFHEEGIELEGLIKPPPQQ